MLRDGTSRVFRTRTWLAHIISAKSARFGVTVKIFFHLNTGKEALPVCLLMWHVVRPLLPLPSRFVAVPSFSSVLKWRKNCAIFTTRKTVDAEFVVVVVSAQRATFTICYSYRFLLLLLFCLLYRSRRTENAFDDDSFMLWILRGRYNNMSFPFYPWKFMSFYNGVFLSRWYSCLF